MRIPIRMIGIATTFFWIFLIAFFTSAVYSIKDVHFDFGEPQMSVTADNLMVFSFPITVENKGFYNIGLFKITTEISDGEGFIITRGSTSIPIINKADVVTLTHNMTVNVTDVLQSDRNYLFNDTELIITETLSMRIAEAIPIQASTNFSIPWGAPLHNFNLGETEYAEYNSTHYRVVVPTSFENHAVFDLTGNIQIYNYNSTHKLLGSGQTTIEVQQSSPYNGYIELYVPKEGRTESGFYKIYFLTPFFNYGPLVIPYG